MEINKKVGVHSERLQILGRIHRLDKLANVHEVGSVAKLHRIAGLIQWLFANQQFLAKLFVKH